jgi:hypothetical protein
VRALLALLALLVLPATARAADVPPRLKRGPVATGAAIFPGAVVHGSGHFVAGDRRTGYRLLAMEGVGVGLTLGGFATLATTGASRQLAPPIFALPVAGLGLFLVSWLADIHGVTAPEDWRGAPLLLAPTVEARLGTRYVYDPTVDYGTLIGPALDLRWGGLRVSPGAWIASSGHNTRLNLEVGWRFWGPRPWAPAQDGSFGDLVLGATHHRFRENFDLTVLEVGGRGRTDLRRFAASLDGSFAEWGLGLGWALTHYQVGAHETDAQGLLLARFGWGLYFGHAPGRTGEVMAYYDHRHDDYAGGAKVTGLGSGAAGHVGLEGTWYFLARWGVRAELQAGSVYLAGLSVIHRSALAGTP